MRRLLLLFVLVVAACGGSSGGSSATPEPVQHAPEISNLKLSPGSALYMEGDGSIQVTAEFSFTDLGRDIESLHVEMSDGTSLTIELADSINTVSGTLAETFDVATADADGCTVEIWLVDSAGQISNHLSAQFDVVRHVPEISDLKLSPDTALYMEGDGSLVVTAEIGFRDSGLDIETLWVRMPDGTSVEFGESFATEAGMFTEDLAMPTNQIGAFAVEFWLVDQAGDSSDPVTAQFHVLADVQASNWTNRLSGLPHALFDVVWNGNVFIAVGERGAIFTSADGSNWGVIDSGTDANLYAVAADGAYVVAVGFELEGGPGIILQSTDHGASWTVKDRPTEAVLEAVAINSPQVVVGGYRWSWGTAITMISEDRGDTWRAVNSWTDENLQITDLVYRDGMFVATTNSVLRPTEGAWVTISSDGKLWSEIAVSDEYAFLRTILHDGSQFILAGSWGAVFTSPDGFNWTQLQTPVGDVSYTGVAWNGSRLMVAGGSMCGELWFCDSPFDVPVGLSSTDGGLTWEIFNIDGDYESRGVAWGNGRFVSVGEKPRFLGEGAIYTAD